MKFKSETRFLYRMHKKNNLEKGIWKDAPVMLETELSSQYGVCGAEGVEEDDYFAMPCLSYLVQTDIPVLKKYGYVVSRIEVSAWGEVEDDNGKILECVFKMADVVGVVEVA